MNDPGKGYASAEAMEALKADAIISIQTPSKVGSKEGTEDSGRNDERANLAELTENIRRQQQQLESQENGTIKVVSG